MKQNETKLQRFETKLQQNGTKLQQNETKSGIFYKNVCYDNNIEFYQKPPKTFVLG